jgi:hypothetical protein
MSGSAARSIVNALNATQIPRLSGMIASLPVVPKSDCAQ